MPDIDAKVSVGEASLELLASLGGKLDAVHSVLRALQDAELRYQQEGPVDVPLRNSATSASTGNLSISLGGPNVGRKWEIRRLVIGGANWGSTVAGTAEFYVAAGPPMLVATGRNLADMVDQASGAAPPLPALSFYSSGQIVLRHPQELVVVIVGPTATTLYVAGGAAIDLPDIPAPARQPV